MDVTEMSVKEFKIELIRLNERTRYVSVKQKFIQEKFNVKSNGLYNRRKMRK